MPYWYIGIWALHFGSGIGGPPSNLWYDDFMVIGTAISKNGTTIRLTDERWFHIIYSHREIDVTDFTTVMDTIENPDLILKGNKGELLAVKRRGRRKEWFVVVYKELSKKDGFVLTAYITTNSHWLLKREIIWNKQS